jgi:hypothetical protein
MPRRGLRSLPKVPGYDSRMNFLRPVIAALVILFVYPAPSPAGRPPWGDLSSWVGEYPTKQESGHVKHLWREPAVRQSLSSLLSQTDLKRLESILSAEKRILKINNFIVVEQCMPHACPSAHAMVILSTEDRRLWVGFYERTRSLVSTRWRLTLRLSCRTEPRICPSYPYYCPAANLRWVSLVNRHGWICGRNPSTSG